MAICYSGYTAMIYVGYIGIGSGCTPYMDSDSVADMLRYGTPNVLRYTPAELYWSGRTCQTHGVLRNILRFYTVFYAALRRSYALEMAV